MIRAAVIGVAAAAVVAGAPARAGADPCEDSVIDPVAVPLRDGGIDATRGACLRGDLAVRTVGHALIDPPGFYGTAGAELDVAVRFLEELGLEWGASMRVVDVTFAQTAVVTATEASYGPVSLHAALGHRPARDVRLASYLRVEIPFTRSQLQLSSAGGQLAGLLTWALSEQLALHGRGGVLAWYGASAGGTTGRGAFVASGDLAVRALPWLVASGGLEAQVGWHGPGLDHLGAKAAVHWRVRGPWRVEVGALLPFLGEERTDAVVAAGVRRDR